MNSTPIRTLVFMIMIICCFLPAVSSAEDMRVVSAQAEIDKQKLFEQAAREKLEAERQATESRAVILKDRTRLEQAISKLQDRKATLKKDIAALQDVRESLAEQETQVTEELARTSQMVNELVGVVRVTAKDVKGLFSENLQSALRDYPDFLSTLSDENSFPGMESITSLAELLFSEIDTTSQVQRLTGTIVDRDGKNVQAEILILGPFCAAYRSGDEAGFLRYSPAGRKLYALSKLPPKRMQNQIHLYMDGESNSITMDIGRGAALQQLSHSLSLWEQLEEGGPIVWPILAILILGLLIIFERIVFLIRTHFNSDRFMQSLCDAVIKADWHCCDEFCRRYLKKPVARVIHAGLQSRELEREEMENVLQEAILREIPPMERFLSTLGMLAAIAPLLGLLGTVTGMIDTFHTITLHGTSDPRLMSGGISEALVTTMLGLGVAIPLMLSQTLLNRSIEKEIGTLEEKAVALVNTIYKSRLES